MAVVCLLPSLPAISQVQNGQITGVVTDQSGAIVAHASVHVSNLATGYEADCESNDAGIYTASELLVGPYVIRVERTGFKTELATNLVVNAGTVLRVDFKLILGKRSETIEVRDVARLVNTETSRLFYTENSIQVANPPLNGRNEHDDQILVAVSRCNTSSLIPCRLNLRMGIGMTRG